MKVYVVEGGCYDSRYVVGVYATAEAAMAAHPPGRDGKVLRPGGWQPEGRGGWGNGLDWDYAAHVREYEVEGLA